MADDAAGGTADDSADDSADYNAGRAAIVLAGGLLLPFVAVEATVRRTYDCCHAPPRDLADREVTQIAPPDATPQQSGVSQLTVSAPHEAWGAASQGASGEVNLSVKQPSSDSKGTDPGAAPAAPNKAPSASNSNAPAQPPQSVACQSPSVQRPGNGGGGAATIDPISAGDCLNLCCICLS